MRVFRRVLYIAADLSKLINPEKPTNTHPERRQLSAAFLFGW
jgi:hypothetical protein